MIATASKRQRRLRLVRPAGAYERMMTKVKVVGDCWLFEGARDQNGHGNVRIKRTRSDGTEYWTCDKAHRISHVHHFGPIPPGLVVRHACDVSNCVRPEHIRETGTQAMNVADMIMRRRAANQYGNWCETIDPDCPF
jgi:hypothetical protein